MVVSPNFEELVAEYRNTLEHNDYLWRKMTDATWADPTLTEHRRHIEQHKLGFGDAAFHAMWLRLLDAAGRRFGNVRALEIGVFKGQVISLWSLISRQLDIPVAISAITPLAGNPRPKFGLWQKVRFRVDRKFREFVTTGNYYSHNEDYEATIRDLFERFQLSFEAALIHKGLSTDEAILATLEKATFHIVYIDGDHTYEGSSVDVRNFAPKVVQGGWLVMDDASYDLPGTAFWKGYESVGRACELLPGLGFKNILNVGHNRIYEKCC